MEPSVPRTPRARCSGVSGLSRETQRVLSHERVILICNHDYDIEPIILMFALPHRDSLRLIVNDVYVGFLPSFDKYLIPVYLSHIINPKGLMHRVQDQRYGDMRDSTVSKEHNHARNRESIRTASRELDNGSMIMIFPFPSWAPQGKWYTGVGHLLHQTTCDEAIYVVNARITGTCRWDWLRLVPLARILLPRLTVTFDAPYLANDLRSLNGKEITRILEKRYGEWRQNTPTLE